MKVAAILLAVVAVLVVVLALTNPDEADFHRWYEARMRETSAGTSGLTGLVARAKGTALSVSARASLKRKSYVLFSLYHIRALDEPQTHLGLLGTFVPL